MRSSSNYRVFWRWLVVVFFLDQFTKWLVLSCLNQPVVIIPHFFSLRLVLNDGAAWNLLSGQRFFLLFFGFFALACFAYFRRVLGLRFTVYQRVFGLIVGGILGNLLDRARTGEVVDFLDFHINRFRWPAFNVADVAICIGVCFYFVLQLRRAN